VQDLKLFRDQRVDQEAHAGEVAAGPVETGDKAQLDRIGASKEDDWNGCGCRLGRHGRGSAAYCYDNGDLAANKLGRKRWQPFVLILRPAILERHILSLDVASILQACRIAATRKASGFDDPLPRNPTTGIVGCCAHAADGHAAAPPISVMNSRRLIRSSRRRGRSRSGALQRLMSEQCLC
jgi:hypothetical protein